MALFVIIDYMENQKKQFGKELPQERLQARAEIFADQGIENFSEDQKTLLKYSSELAKIKDLDDLPKDLPKELVELINKYKKAYINFLRENKIESEFIEKNIETYNQKFKSVIFELKEKIAYGNIKELPEYLGSGSNGIAFRIEVDGKKYAAKFTRNATQRNLEIKPLLRAKGIDHVSQLVSYSHEDDVVIMELLPGEDITNFTPENAPTYTDEEIIGLIKIVIELDSKGLVIDPKPSNFMYDKEKGFSILDYHLKQDGSTYDLAKQIRDLVMYRSALTDRKFERLDYKSPDYDEKSDIERDVRNKILLEMKPRFMSILEKNFPEIFQKIKDMENKTKK